MTHRKSFALMAVLLFAVSMAFASSVAALPKCQNICTITCPCDTPCTLIGRTTTCAEFACGPPVGSLTLVSADDFPILEVAEEMDGDAEANLATAPSEEAMQQATAE